MLIVVGVDSAVGAEVGVAPATVAIDGMVAVGVATAVDAAGAATWVAVGGDGAALVADGGGVGVTLAEQPTTRVSASRSASPTDEPVRRG